MGELAGYNLYATIRRSKLKEFAQLTLVHLQALDVKMVLQQLVETIFHLKVFQLSLMKEASHVRYLSHIKALYGLAY